MATKYRHVHGTIFKTFTTTWLGLKVVDDHLSHSVHNNGTNNVRSIWWPNLYIKPEPSNRKDDSEGEGVNPRPSNEAEDKKIFYVNNQVQSRSLSPKETIRVGRVDPRSSNLICNSCYGIRKIYSQCTLKLFKVKKVVKNYETLGAMMTHDSNV